LSGTYTLRVSKSSFAEKSVEFTNGKTSYAIFLGNMTLEYSVQYSLPVRNITIPALSYVYLPFTITNNGSRTEEVDLSASARNI